MIGSDIDVFVMNGQNSGKNCKKMQNLIKHGRHSNLPVISKKISDVQIILLSVLHVCLLISLWGPNK